MSHTIEALFDGSAFHPIRPVSLAPNVRVRLTVEAIVPTNFLHIARSLKLDGPSDWATNIEEYLYHEEPHNEP